MSRNLKLGETPAPGQHSHRADAWTPSGESHCVCGASVSSEVARIIGVDGVVPACKHCLIAISGERCITSTTKAVVLWRGQRGQRKANVEIDADAHPEVSE